MEGRVGNLIGFNLWSSFNHSRQDLRHFGIRCAVVGFRVLCCVPKADSERFRSAWDDKREALQLGADDYVEKPFDLPTLAKTVQRNLEQLRVAS